MSSYCKLSVIMRRYLISEIDKLPSMLETHYKTAIVFVSFGITVSGWWAWNAFLSAAYSDNLSPYDVQHGFVHGFGSEPCWWFVLIVILALLFAIELSLKYVQRAWAVGGSRPPWKRKSQERPTNAEEIDVQIWQELQKEADIQEKLARLAHDGTDGIDKDYEDTR